MQTLEDTARRYAQEWVALKGNDKLEAPTLASLSGTLVCMRMQGKDTSDLDDRRIQGTRESLENFMEILAVEVKKIRDWAKQFDEPPAQEEDASEPSNL